MALQLMGFYESGGCTPPNIQIITRLTDWYVGQITGLKRAWEICVTASCILRWQTASQLRGSDQTRRGAQAVRLVPARIS